MALSEEAQLGNWQVQVQVEAEVFTSNLNISLADEISGVQVPEVAMAEEHYVELRFGHEMRRLYKPGLPFVGKVCFLNRPFIISQTSVSVIRQFHSRHTW